MARGASAGSTRAQPIQALPVHVVRQHPRPLGRQQEGLSARPGAEVEDGLAGLRPDEQAQELAAFVLRLEEPLAPGVRAEQIGPGRRDPQGIGSPGAHRRGDSFVREPRGQRIARAKEAVRAQAHGTGNRDGRAEISCVVAQLREEVRLQPVRQRPAIRQAQRRGLPRRGHGEARQ